MALFENTGFRVMEQSLNALWVKKDVVSQNIANISTPNYKAKTVTFGAVMENERYKYRFNHDTDYRGMEIGMRVTTEEGTTQRMDGNNVDIEKESIALADAQLQSAALIDKINGQFKAIRTALQKN